MLADAFASLLSSLIPLLTLAAAAIGLRLLWQGRSGWRVYTGQALIAVAIALMLSLILHGLPPQRPAPTPSQQEAAPVRHPIPAPPSRTQKQGPRPATPAPGATRSQQPAKSIEIIALSNGMVSIQENGKIYTLHVGQSTPGGWRLLSANTLRAELLRPDGRHYIYRP